MADDYSKPIHTLITEDIVESLSRVPYLTVERLNADNHEFNLPKHMLAIVDPDDPEKLEDNGSTDDEFIRTYIIHVWIMPSQTDGVPLDETWDKVAADVVKALCFDDGLTNPRPHTRNGLAVDTTASDANVAGPMPNSLAYMLNVPIEVQYTTRTCNAYNPNRG